MGAIVSAEFSPLVAELVALIGRRAALALCRTGGEIYIPTRIGSRARLVRLIGPGATSKLQAKWAGRQMKLPTLAAINRDNRNDEIKRQAAAGKSIAELALLTGLSVRHIRNILAPNQSPNS